MTAKNKKRSFGVDTTVLPTEAPMIDSGSYAGVITNAATVGKENKQYITIAEETKYNRDTKKSEPTGEWIIKGNIFFGVTLTSKKAIKILQRDEPKFFGGAIRLAFDKETLCLAENPVLGAWLTALGLKDIDFNAQAEADFIYNEDIEIPEELAHIPNIVDMLNSLEYQRILFGIIAQTANGLPCKVVIKKAPAWNNPAKQENTIDTGNFNDFCGILAYEDGCEFDLEDSE